MGVEPLPLDPKWAQALQGVTTATLTTVLLKKGLRNVWMRGAKAMRADTPRIVGRAFTLRFVPAREDLATPASWGSPISTRAAIEAMPAGCVAVVDAMGLIPNDSSIFTEGGDEHTNRHLSERFHFGNAHLVAAINDAFVMFSSCIIGSRCSFISGGG